MNGTEQAVHDLLVSLGLDITSEHLRDTPVRIAKFYQAWLAQGEENFRFTTFEAPPNAKMVMTGNIRFFSMCAHHFVPFFGMAHIAYLPGRRLAGLSKLARTVQMFAHSPQVQEELTEQIASYLMKKLEARGVGVLLEAEHLCMSMRGAEVPGHLTVTECVLGALRHQQYLSQFRHHVQVVRKE